MSEDDPQSIDDKVNRGERDQTANWVRRGVMILVAIVSVFVLYKVAASFLPRWWAQRMADQVDGGLTKGTLWGLFYGFLFTFLPVVLVFQIRRHFLNWKAKVVVVVVALVLAAPNWLTLSVVAGNSRAAHAGERIMDVDVPGFRWASLIGVVVGAILAIGLSSASMLLSHRRKQVKDLKKQVRQGKEPREGHSDTEDTGNTN